MGEDIHKLLNPPANKKRRKKTKMNRTLVLATYAVKNQKQYKTCPVSSKKVINKSIKNMLVSGQNRGLNQSCHDI